LLGEDPSWSLLLNIRQRGSVIEIFQQRSRKVFRPIEALVAVSIAVAFVSSMARLDAQAAGSSEILSSIQEQVTRSSLLYQDGRYKEADPRALLISA
jgi:hypothetical protein